ncbi:MAG: DUF6527 family protein [Candidatus Pseudobacter hemicellulosilyticus]|uniref:DUF6527 family protein n=1 Tax=Candidatus Pseudobacter hemicellulosilyticus TaxID=3121375 RepID=A0AAJ5WSQ8_9BACT|nr:MAG: DUF6527 family protein [Pseudobacter sp.]
MLRTLTLQYLQHKFVDSIPDNVGEGILYVCIEYGTVVHKCVCGCQNEVVTPLSPKDWKLTFDGETISLYPSIGNWRFKCKSHYWITNNRIIHAPKSGDPARRRRKRWFSW